MAIDLSLVTPSASAPQAAAPRRIAGDAGRPARGDSRAETFADVVARTARRSEGENLRGRDVPQARVGGDGAATREAVRDEQEAPDASENAPRLATPVLVAPPLAPGEGAGGGITAGATGGPGADEETGQPTEPTGAGAVVQPDADGNGVAGQLAAVAARQVGPCLDPNPGDTGQPSGPPAHGDTQRRNRVCGTITDQQVASPPGVTAEPQAVPQPRSRGRSSSLESTAGSSQPAGEAGRVAGESRFEAVDPGTIVDPAALGSVATPPATRHMDPAEQAVRASVSEGRTAPRDEPGPARAPVPGAAQPPVDLEPRAREAGASSPVQGSQPDATRNVAVVRSSTGEGANSPRSSAAAARLAAQLQALLGRDDMSGAPGKPVTTDPVAVATDALAPGQAPSAQEPVAPVTTNIRSAGTDPGRARFAALAGAESPVLAQPGAFAAFVTNVPGQTNSTQGERRHGEVSSPPPPSAVDRGLTVEGWLPGSTPAAGGIRAPLEASATTGAVSAASVGDEHGVVQQVVKAVHLQWRQGLGEARLRLDPPHLGEIHVSLRVQEGAVSAVVRAENPAVQAWIDTRQQDLRAALEEQGLRLEQFEVVVDPDGRRRDSNEQQAPSPRARAPRPRPDAPRFEVNV